MSWHDWFRAAFLDAEQIISHEGKELETVITDALNALAAAVNNVVSERASDKAALAQAQADRDAAQASLADAQKQLADAESQINGLVAQLNPPAA